MLIDKLPQPLELPDSIEPLCSDLEKLLLVVNNASTPKHLDVSERMLINFSKKWGLTSKNQIDLICTSIQDKIFRKKGEFNALDSLHAIDG